MAEIQILSESDDWICFIPKEEISKGHICFYPKEWNSIIFGKMYRAATDYGDSMKKIGMYSDYLVYSLSRNIHLIPIIDNKNLPTNWIARLTKIDKSVIV